MKLAVSNLAWSTADDAAATAMMLELGVTALEMAPTRLWPDLSQVTEMQARTVRDALQNRGIAVVALQAILFGQPQLQVFGPEGGADCQRYLSAVCRLAGWLGATATVLGAPKNRLRGDLTAREACARAVDFFRPLGEISLTSGTRLCLEPNPAVYGGDFLLTVQETAELVTAVNSGGVAMNFDMGEQALNHADVAANLKAVLPLVGHFHASEPMLEPLNAGRPAHAEAAAVLLKYGYSGAISLEMKTPAGGLGAVRASLAAMQLLYPS